MTYFSIFALRAASSLFVLVGRILCDFELFCVRFSKLELVDCPLLHLINELYVVAENLRYIDISEGRHLSIQDAM